MEEKTITAKEFLEESWESGNLFPAIILVMIFGFDKLSENGGVASESFSSV